MMVPMLLIFIADLQFVTEIIQYAQIIYGLDVAGNMVGEATYLRLISASRAWGREGPSRAEGIFLGGLDASKGEIQSLSDRLLRFGDSVHVILLGGRRHQQEASVRQ